MPFGSRRTLGGGTNSFGEVDGLDPSCIGELVPGVGVSQTIAGSGTITASGSTNSSAVFNLQVYLFYPEAFAPNPVVQYDGLWWPAMSISCAVTNSVTVSGGGARAITFECDSYDPGSTIEIGTFSFFGTAVPVSCASLGPGETRTFSGSIAVEDEWA